jgi:DNA-binding MarR family transcriptional regulator
MTHPVQMLAGGSLLHRLVRDMTTVLDRRFAAFGLTTQQAALLLAAGSGTSTPRQLMDLIGTDTAGLTRLLDRLQGKGLAGRRPNPADRRSVLVVPTDSGLALVPELAPVFGEVVMQLFAGFADTEIAQFTSALQRMSQNLERSSGAGPGKA